MVEHTGYAKVNLEESFVLGNELVVVVVVVEALVLVVVEVLLLHFWPRRCHNCLWSRLLQRGGGWRGFRENEDDELLGVSLDQKRDD